FDGVALTATIVAFGAALYMERRSSMLKDEQRQLRERLAFDLDVNRHYIEDQARGQRRVVVPVSAIGDPSVVSYELVPDVRGYLDGISDHLFLIDPGVLLIYLSPTARLLDPEVVSLVRRTMLRQAITRRAGSLAMDSTGIG